MSDPTANRPYYDAWLKRTGRQLGASGILTQISCRLTIDEGGTATAWKLKLRRLLDGDEMPTMDLVMKIDALLATQCGKQVVNVASQGILFD